MGSRKLIICDPEPDYASRLAEFLSEKEELAFQVNLCTSLEQIPQDQGDAPADLLLISAAWGRQQREKVRAKKIIVLTDRRHTDLNEGEVSVFKYQSGDDIYIQMIQALGEEDAKDLLYVRKKRHGKVIGVYSPVHRIGKTTFAIRKGRELSEQNNVLYLNLETYAGIGAHFPEERKQNLSVLLYYAKQEAGNLGLVLTTLVKKSGNLDYIPPSIFSEDVKAVEEKEWKQLFQEILEQSIYEVLVLDIGECVQGLPGILKRCDTVYMPVASDEVSAAKIRQFEENMWQLGYGEVWERMIHCDTGGTTARKDSGAPGPVQRN